MTEFQVINWVLCLATSLSLLFLFFLQKFLVVKPSIIVIFFFHLTIQWAATLESGYIEYYLKDPSIFAILVHGFPLIGLHISAVTFPRKARKIYQRIISINPYDLLIVIERQRTAIILITITTIIVGLYLSVVPLNKTGLLTIFTDPENSKLAREESLKLIPNPLIRYSYSFMSSSFASLLSVLLATIFIYALHKKQFVFGLAVIVVMFYLLIVVGLTGARSNSASILLTLMIAFLFKKGLKVNWLYIVVGVLTILTIPTLLTILREGQEITLAFFFEYLKESIFSRIFNTPMITGLWHVHYAQNNGFFGIAGIPRLAVLFGIEPIKVANLIGLEYVLNPHESISANTCYVFSYYSYLGTVSIPISLFGLFLIDYLSIEVYSKIRNFLLLPCTASIATNSLGFISSDYTTVFITHGFAMTLFMALVLDRVSRRKFRFLKS